MRKLVRRTELTEEVGKEVLAAYDKMVEQYPGKSDAWHLRLVAEETGLRMDTIREVLCATEAE